MVKWSLQVKCLHSFKEKTYSEREVTPFKIVLSVPAHENMYQILSALLSVRSGMKSFTTRFQKAMVTVWVLKVCFLTRGRDSAGLPPPFKGFLISWCNVTNRLRGVSFEFSQPVSRTITEQEGLCLLDFIMTAEQYPQSTLCEKRVVPISHSLNSDTNSSFYYLCFAFMETWPICDFVGWDLDLETVPWWGCIFYFL